MEAIGSLQQLGVVLLILLGSVVALELSLYSLFKWNDRSWFLPTILFLAASLGWIFGKQNAAIESGVTVALVCGASVGLCFKYLIKGRGMFPTLMLAPAFVSIACLVIYPFFFEIRIAFANLNMYTVNQWISSGELGWAGFDNFYRVFTSSPLQTATFWQLLLRTLMWTAINLVFHVGFGLCLALLLNRKILLKGFYRTLLIVPWAMPQVVAVLAWRGEFHPEFGFINQLLQVLHIPVVNWWSDPLPVFISCCLVNIWLGIPFMTIVFLGGLQAIPRSCYEAAEIDGASRWQQFTKITLPLLKPTVIPSVTLGTIWTFNNVNVIYLMTGQDGGNEFADILVTALYKSAFTYSRFSFSAAFALVICAILILLTLGWIKISKATESAAL